MYTACCDASVKKVTLEGRRSRISYVIYSPENEVIVEHSEQIDIYNSMQAEYLAMIELLKKIIALDLSNVKIITDCLNMVSQINRVNKTRKLVSEYIKTICELLSRIKNAKVEWMKRRFNKHANYLSKSEVYKYCNYCDTHKHYLEFKTSRLQRTKPICKCCSNKLNRGEPIVTSC